MNRGSGQHDGDVPDPSTPDSGWDAQPGSGARSGFRRGPARRAMIRWAWRLFRREWRQQLLVLSLITVSVAATVIGAAVATNTGKPSGAAWGTADYLTTLPGDDPHLAADLAAIRRGFGSTDVIEEQTLNTGFAQGAELRAQDPHGPYGSTMLALVSGRYPQGSGEVAMTSRLAATLGVHLGGTWIENGRALSVVGVVQNPLNFTEDFALVPPGQLAAPDAVTVLFDAKPLAVAEFTFPAAASPPAPPPPSTDLALQLIVLAVGMFGLIFIGLVATAGFTVLAQRRLRAIGLLSSLGATDRNVRLVMVANGLVVGAIGALAGAVLGVAGWIAYVPTFQAGAGHRVSWTTMPWWLVAASMLLAVATAGLAARRPARAVARVPIVAALAGRPGPPRPARRSVRPALACLAVGLVLVLVSGGRQAFGGSNQIDLLAGVAVIAVGLLLAGPIAIAGLAAAGRGAPIAVRIALRDLARYRARSGPTLAAGSFAVFIAVVVCLLATSRYSDPIDYVGPNLPANQVLVAAAGPTIHVDTAAGGPSAPPGAATPAQQAARLRTGAAAIAADLGTENLLELDAAGADLARTGGGTSEGDPGTVYVATPALLAHYGISPGSIAPGTLMLTSRPDLAGLSGLSIQYGNFDDPNADIRTLPDPRIQTLTALPTGTADPNLLVTTTAVSELKLTTTAAAWLVQTARPLTGEKLSTIRRVAESAGLTVQTTNDLPSLGEVRNDATAAGILLALGVLAMTVGLIRSETADDLRILSAAGAARRTRRPDIRPVQSRQPGEARAAQRRSPPGEERIVSRQADRPTGSEPVAPTERGVQHRGDPDHHHDRDPESGRRPEPRIRHVLPVEPGDGRRHRDDRGPAGHLLHDQVHPVALQSQVRLPDRADHVAQGVGHLGRAQSVVVDILVVRQQIRVQDVQVAAHHRVQHLAHGRDHPARGQQRAAQVERPAQRGVGLAPVQLEDLVAERVHYVVEVQQRAEVRVDDVVDQAVEEESDAVHGQVRGVVPARDHLGDVEVGPPVHGRQDVGREERGDLVRLQDPGALLARHRVGVEEQVPAVTVELGPLVLLHRVLDRQRVQAELVAELFEVP